MPALRIDDVIAHPDGVIEVRITHGASPLPAKWSGTAVRFPSKAALLDDPTSALSDSVLLALLVRWWRAQDASLTDVTKVRGKTMTLDPSGALLDKVLDSPVATVR